jgi:hypothetical protein
VRCHTKNLLEVAKTMANPLPAEATNRRREQTSERKANSTFEFEIIKCEFFDDWNADLERRNDPIAQVVSNQEICRDKPTVTSDIVENDILRRIKR